MTKSITKHIKTKLKNCSTYSLQNLVKLSDERGEHILILVTHTTSTSADHRRRTDIERSKSLEI